MTRKDHLQCWAWLGVPALLAATLLTACSPQDQNAAEAETPETMAIQETQQEKLVANARQEEGNENGKGEAIPGVAKEKFPRLDGSTSTIPLSQLIACRVLGLRGELRRGLPSRYINQGSLALVFPLATDPAQVEEYARLQPYHRGTHQAYTRLLAGQADLILVAREPSADELKSAQTNKVQLEARPIALDALVVLVNKANPVKELSLEQVRAIFTGATKLWRPLGGEDFPIKAFTRNLNSGSQELMEKLVLKGRKIAAGDDVRMVTEMGEVLQRVATNRNAIGYSIFYYERVMNPTPQNRQLAIAGVLPSSQTIADRSYPLVSPVYVVTRKDVPATSPTIKLRDWLLGREGQELVGASGYVPMQPRQ